MSTSKIFGIGIALIVVLFIWGSSIDGSAAMLPGMCITVLLFSMIVIAVVKGIEALTKKRKPLEQEKPDHRNESEPVNLESPKVQVKQSEYFEFSEKIRSRFGKDLPTFEISMVLSMSNSEDKIIMMKYIDSFSNVLRCKNDGTLIWQAELPTSTNDVYTNISWQENQLTAFSRSCIAVTIDTETGKILSPKSKS